MTKLKTLLISASIAACAGMPAAYAQSHDHSAHGGHAAHGAAEESAAAKAYNEANRQMHEAMDVEMTGDADVDFMRSMIPHHEGAVAMARIVLEHGKDPEVRKLAEDVIATQEVEIKFMKDWLAKHGYGD